MSRIAQVASGLVTREQAAEIIGINHATLRRWLAQGYVIPAWPGLDSSEMMDPPPLADIGMRSFGLREEIEEWRATYQAARERSRKARIKR